MTAPSAMPHAPSPAPRRLPLAAPGFAFALLCGLALILSGFGYRWGWWGLRPAFRLLRWSAYGGAAAGLLSLTCLVLAWPPRSRRGAWLGLLGVLVSLVVVGVPWSWLRRAQHVPPIHDITTDTTNPPAFVAVLPLRASAPDPPQYGGAEVAAKQLAAYPDITPVVLAIPRAQAFERALAVARAMSWTIVAADSAAGRIEATATTFWYGFKDDVVIRVSAADGGARIDVRSESRVGGGDVGTNAARIRAYLKKVTGS